MSEENVKPKHSSFVIVPRIVRMEYRDLTHGEKWLYVCLRDLCGDGGTCFRSLRTLEEETGIAFGSLGPMIKHLHKAGLIHAEKKRRPGGTRDLWHITITDIWVKNAEYIAEHKKEDANQQGQSNYIEEYTEQMEELDNVQNSHIGVQKSHTNVQISHKDHVQCSEITRECVKNLTEEERVNKTSLTTNKNRERKNALSRSKSLSSEEQNRIHEYFLQCSPRVPQVNDALKGYWSKLAPRIASQEEMNSLYEYTKRKCAGKADPRVYPGNLVEWVEAWEQEHNTDNTWSVPAREEDITEPDETLIYDQPASYWTEERILHQRPIRQKVIRDRLQELAQSALVAL